MSEEQKTPHSRHFSSDEANALGRRLQAGSELMCPACASPMDVREIPQRTDVSYVRDRVLVACPVCHRTSVLDRREVR